MAMGSNVEFLRRIKIAKKIFKVCLIGDGGTGKTTFMTYLVENQLIVCQDPLKRTPYMDFGTAKVGEYTIQLFDLAGQRVEDAHPLDHIPRTALRAADAIIFFFSLGNFESFLSVTNWFNEIVGLYEEWGEEVPSCYLVGNKTDLLRQVESVNGEELVRSIKEFRTYHEISLLTGQNIENLLAVLEEAMKSR